MATSYDISKEDVHTMWWEEIRATPDYDPAKDTTYALELPNMESVHPDNLEICTKYVRKYLSHIRNGDVLHIGEDEETSLAFWSNTKGVILPDYESGNSYGTVPDDFRVGTGTNEFHPLHWMKMDGWKEYDGHICLNDTLISEINASIVRNIERTYTCKVMICGTLFQIESAVPNPTKFELMSDSLIVSFE